MIRLLEIWLAIRICAVGFIFEIEMNEINHYKIVDTEMAGFLWRI
jgi:hypothetical protein